MKSKSEVSTIVIFWEN